MATLYNLFSNSLHSSLSKCNLILTECSLTLKSLLSIHNEIDNEKEKEDLLRAMFIFATSGLDSLLKQAIRDSLPYLLDINEGANTMFEEFVSQDIQLKKGDSVRIDSKLMAKLLTTPNPREELKKRLCYYLTNDSLQSKDQIFRIASYFDIPSKSIVDDFDELSKIFKERNKIIHEMDINFSGDRSRNKRNLDETVQFINVLLIIGEKFLTELNNRLNVSN